MRFLLNLMLVAVLAVLAAGAVFVGGSPGQSAGEPWPLRTVPQKTIEDGGTRLVGANAAEESSVKTSSDEASRVIMDRNPDSELREVKLVRVYSAGSGQPGIDRLSGPQSRLVWAVSIMPPGGPTCHGCGGASRLEAIEHVTGLSAAEAANRVLTIDEEERVVTETQRMVDAYLATLQDPYYVEFVDASTGEFAFGWSGWGSRK